MFKAFMKSNNDKTLFPIVKINLDLFSNSKQESKTGCKKIKRSVSKIHGLNWYNSYLLKVKKK